MCLWSTGIMRTLHSLSKKSIVACFLSTISIFAIVIAIMARERYVYYWDNGSYWYKTLDFQNSLSLGGWEGVKTLLHSINCNEYNDLACAVIALPLKIFGNSYLAFVILNTVLFYIPNAFLMAFTIFRIIEKFSMHTVDLVWIYMYSLTFSIVLFPVLLGYVDIAGMIPLTTAYLLVIDRDFKRVEILKDILLGISFLWIVLLRRYYAYAAVGGAIFALAFWFTYGIEKKTPFYRIQNKLIDTAIAVSIPLVGLMAFFQPFLLSSIFNNHSYAYSAYKSTGYIGEWQNFGRYYGLLFITFAFLGVVLNIRKSTNKLVVSLILGLFTSCQLFFGIQDMGWQHYYITAFPMCCLIFLGIHALIYIPCKKRFAQLGIRMLAISIAAGNFFMSIGIGTSYKSVLWQSYTYIPRIRNDLYELNKLENYLERMSRDGVRNVYCLGSSGILNSDILFKLNAPDINREISYAAVTHVDLRDGFRTDFFESDIILACDPVQYHLSHGQEVIHQLNEIMRSDNEFSENYEVTEVFELDEGVRVFAYVKQKPLETTDIEFICDTFTEIYPDHPELFADRINAYLTKNK